MSHHIHSWVDGHLAIRQRAYETRGFVEIDSGTRWPRTTGADVISIAALVNPAVRQHATPGVLRRWVATCADLQHDALPSAQDTYPENRSFWASLESTVIYLDDIAVAPPSAALWDALIAEVGARRNVGPTTDGPIAHFDNIKTYDDLYNSQLKFLKEKRGTDARDQPPGHSGGTRDIPRTTNADVLQLATYWSNELAKVKHVFGHDGVVARWTPVVDDVDKLAKPGKPDEVYAKNNEFWREMQQVAIQIAVADEAPSKWDMVVDSVKDSIVHLPQNLGVAASKGAELIESAAHAVGKVANEAGKGLFSGLGAPVLIGAGLIGLFLISRNRSHHEEA
jgi:hypothetical protein